MSWQRERVKQCLGGDPREQGEEVEGKAGKRKTRKNDIMSELYR